MARNFKRTINSLFIIILFLVIGVYAFVKTRAIAKGVNISIPALYDGASYTVSNLQIEGKAEHAITLTLNNRPISVDENGNFTDTLLLPIGYSIITVRGADRFGNVAEKKYSVNRTE